MHSRWWIGALVASAVAGAVGTAEAFEIESSFTHSCHEQISADAMRDIGWPDGATPPAPDDTEQRVIDDLLFDLESLSESPWASALLIGARYNDVGDESPRDVAGLAQLHNDPARQVEHCLRREPDDGDAGDQAALDACRAFILDQLDLAIGADDDIDMDAQIEISTHLKFRGEIEIDVNRYAFHLGRALHALQDSYTHAFRNPDDRRVRHVLNWIEGNLESSHDEARDGHAHIAELDDCSTGIAAERQVWATEASADLIEAVVSPAASRQERLDRADAAIQTHLELEPGCTADNQWCDAEEATLGGCAAAGQGGGIGAALVFAALSFATRRRRDRKRPGGALAAGAALVLMAIAPASAEPPPRRVAKVDIEPEKDPPDSRTERALDRDERVIEAIPDRVTHTWGAALTTAAAFDRAGAAAAAGIRFAPWESVTLGLDVEYNPWVSIADFDVAAGAASVYIPVIWKLRKFGSWELRSTFNAGATMLLFDVVGADKGSIGPFVGWNPLGLAIPLGGDTKLIVKPGDIALPIPQVQGIPFYYHQYRFSIGIEWYP